MLGNLRKQTSSPKKSPSVVPLRRTTREKTHPVRSKSDISVLKKLNKPIDHTLSCLHEIKYLVSESKAEALMRFVELYLPLDRYCKLQPGGSYPIVSLYLDSHNLQLCRESLEGHKNRFKLRIRSYTDDPKYPLFFEIKRRMNTIILKDRARVKHCDTASLISGLALPPHDYNTDHETLKQFRLYVNSINAAPVIKIRYMREAYEGDSHNRVRVTFDRQLAFKAGNTSDVLFNGHRWQHHPGSSVIVETKFTGHYPAWLHQMVRSFDLRQQSMSKYARSIERGCMLRYCAPKIPARFF